MVHQTAVGDDQPVHAVLGADKGAVGHIGQELLALLGIGAEPLLHPVADDRGQCVPGILLGVLDEVLESLVVLAALSAGVAEEPQGDLEVAHPQSAKALPGSGVDLYLPGDPPLAPTHVAYPIRHG